MLNTLCIRCSIFRVPDPDGHDPVQIMAAALLSTEPVASLALVSGVALSMRRMPLTSVQSLSESGTPVLRSRVRETKRKRKEGRKEERK